MHKILNAPCLAAAYQEQQRNSMKVEKPQFVCSTITVNKHVVNSKTSQTEMEKLEYRTWPTKSMKQSHEIENGSTV